MSGGRRGIPAGPPEFIASPQWRLFRRLADGVGARGNDVTDADLAAFAIDDNATWPSADRGFARFEQLRWVYPLDG